MEDKELNNIKFKKIELSDDQLDDVYGGANMTKYCLILCLSYSSFHNSFLYLLIYILN